MRLELRACMRLETTKSAAEEGSVRLDGSADSNLLKLAHPHTPSTGPHNAPPPHTVAPLRTPSAPPPLHKAGANPNKLCRVTILHTQGAPHPAYTNPACIHIAYTDP